jgi:hypothetical protein
MQLGIFNRMAYAATLNLPSFTSLRTEGGDGWPITITSQV